MRADRIAVLLLAAVAATATASAAAYAQGASPAPAPADLIGQRIAPADQSDQVFNRFGLRTIYPLIHRRPLLIVSWRADDAASLERAVPAALTLQETYGHDLVLLFVERSGRPYADMLQLVCHRHWLCGDALWTCEQPAGLELVPSPSFVLTSMWQIAVLTGDLVADREDLERAIAVVVGQRQHGEDDLPAEARMAWTAAADGQWIKALQIDGAAAKRRARGQPGDAEVAAVLDTQAQFLDDVLQNEVQITIEMERSGAAAEARDRAEAYWKVVKELPEDSLLRHSVEGIIENVRHETLFAEIEASEELAKLQDRLCRTGPGGSMVRAFRKLAKTHAGTKAAERALLYAALVTEP